MCSPVPHFAQARRPVGRRRWLVISAALIVDGPWGHMTALYVVGIGGVLAIIATVLGMVATAARDLHRTRLH